MMFKEIQFKGLYQLVLFFCILFILMSCGEVADKFRIKSYTPYASFGIDNRLTAPVELFESMSGLVVDIPVVIDTTNIGAAGSCIEYNDGEKAIVINIDYYNQIKTNRYKEYYLEEVMLHELSHCILNVMNHDNTVITFNGITIARSIMNAYTLNMIHYIKYREYYLDQLFDADVSIYDYNWE